MGLVEQIAELELRKGQIAGAGLRRSGEVWGQTLANIGQTLAGIPKQIQEQKQQEQQRKLGDLQLEDAQRKVADMKAMDQAWQQPGGRDAVIGSLPGHLRPGVMKQFTEWDEAHAKSLEAIEKADTAKADAFGRAAVIVKEHQYDPLAFQGVVSDLKQKYGSDQAMLGQLQKFEQAVQQNPSADFVRSIVDPIIQASPAQRKLMNETMTAEARQTTANRAPAPTTASVALAAAGGDPVKAMESLRPEKPEKTATVGSFEDYVRETYGERPTPAQILAARKAYNQADDRPRITVNTGNPSDVKEVVAGMKDGTLPPQLPGRASKEYSAIMAESRRQGFDLARAATDWQATQKHVATLNGAQQTRMAQAIDNASHSLDVIEDLANQWDGGRFPILNRVSLKAAKGGAMGAKAQQIATNLEAQIADVTSELGNVYMGGNSPTDHALGLAAKNLSADWTKDQLKAALNLARTNLTIRQNSMRNVGVAGASPTNPYATPAQPSGPQPGDTVVTRDASGKLVLKKQGGD